MEITSFKTNQEKPYLVEYESKFEPLDELQLQAIAEKIFKQICTDSDQPIQGQNWEKYSIINQNFSRGQTEKIRHERYFQTIKNYVRRINCVFINCNKLLTKLIKMNEAKTSDQIKQKIVELKSVLNDLTLEQLFFQPSTVIQDLESLLDKNIRATLNQIYTINQPEAFSKLYMDFMDSLDLISLAQNPDQVISNKNIVTDNFNLNTIIAEEIYLAKASKSNTEIQDS